MDYKGDPDTLLCADPSRGYHALPGFPFVAQHFFERNILGIVVAHARTTQRWHNARRLQGGQHRGALHRTTVIGMQNDLVGLYRFTRAEILDYLAGLGAALFGIDLSGWRGYEWT